MSTLKNSHNEMPKHQDQQILFLHIPKTAGTTLRIILANHFSPDTIFPTKEYFREFNGYVPGPKTLAIPDEEFRKYKLVVGHYNYQHIIGKFNPHPFCMTMLRNPFERTISDIKMMLRDPVHFVHNIIPKENLSLETILSNKKVQGYLTNRQVLSFGNDLKQAKKNLSKFDYVGIQEDFENSLKLLFKLFNWKELDTIPKINSSPKEQSDFLKSISKIELEKINDFITEDHEFYEYACKLCDKK